MNHQTLCWAVFVGVLCPIVLAAPGQAGVITAGHVALCLGMVAIADRREQARG